MVLINSNGLMALKKESYFYTPSFYTYILEIVLLRLAKEKWVFGGLKQTNKGGEARWASSKSSMWMST